LTVWLPERLRTKEELVVGIVCRERFHGWGWEGTSDDKLEVVHETLAAFDAAEAKRAVVIHVPADVPFSYDGGIIGWEWAVELRSRRLRWIEARASSPLHVNP